MTLKWSSKSIFSTQVFEPSKRQPHKMVKHTKTIRRQQPTTNCFSVLDLFVGLLLKWLDEFKRITVINFCSSQNQQKTYGFLTTSEEKEVN